MRRALPVLTVTILALGAGSSARAQTDLSIRSSRRDTIVAGATVTAAFAVTSRRADSVQVVSHIETPADWSVLMGAAPLPVGPRSTELLMLSVVVPARAEAGLYTVRVWVTTTADARGTMDSVVVRVPHRRAIDVGLAERPGFVVSGHTYDAGFVVRNRGNAAASLRLSARSSVGTLLFADTVLQLASDESRLVRPHVLTRAGLESATDDVLELTVKSLGDSTFERSASARVTIVPEPTRKIEEYLRIPTQVHLRASSGGGVSPFEVYGQGGIQDGGDTNLDFLFRGPTGPYSLFGERDEYRVQLTAPNWRARAGDQLFALSQLTGAGQPGFGAGVDGSLGRFGAGAYSQQFRRSLTKGMETGAFVSARPSEGARVGLNVVDRGGDVLSGRVASATAAWTSDRYSADVELARSQAGAPGMARTARFSGSTSILSYDVGHLFADTTFAGSQRGAEHNYFTAGSSYLDNVSFSVNGSRHRADLSRSTGVPYLEMLDVATLAATFFDRYTLELGSVMRGTTISGATQDARQTGVRARTDQDFGFGLLSFEVEAGRKHEATGENGVFSDVSLSGRHSFGRGSVGIWADRYSGGSITKGSDGTVTLGGDASLRVAGSTSLMVNAYATRVNVPHAKLHSQVDAILTHSLANGRTISLRARIMTGGNLSAVDQSVAFLEYGLPLRLPIARLRTPGRVYGRVVDAVSGRGVPGALVRLGPQVAITDRDGQVAFGGVPGGEHRLSMSQETSLANAVFVGDPTLLVDSTRTTPTTFQLAIARGARVQVGVRRYAVARTGIGAGADSLVDAGPLSNATIVLSGERDTLYRTTNDHGIAAFNDVPPGHWVLAVRGDAPAFHRFDPDRMDLTLEPGEVRSVALRLLPRRREVQLIGEGQELHPTAADSKAVGTSTTKTVKPNENQKQDH